MAKPAFRTEAEQFAGLPAGERERRIDRELPGLVKASMKVFGNRQQAVDQMAVMAMGNDIAHAEEAADACMAAESRGAADSEQYRAVKEWADSEGMPQRDAIVAMWQQTLANTPQLLHGMKSADAIPRWITVNQRLTARVVSVMESRGWDDSVQPEVEDYFSDLLELAHRTPALQSRPPS